MKSFLLLCVSLILFTGSAFAAEKSGLTKFDLLEYSKGQTVLFFDQEGMETTKKTKDSIIERKVFKQKNSYIVADYDLKKRLILIYETQMDPSKFSELQINGDRVSYYPTGKIESTGKYKNGLEDGVHIYYREDGTTFKSVFKNGQLIKN